MTDNKTPNHCRTIIILLILAIALIIVDIYVSTKPEPAATGAADILAASTVDLPEYVTAKYRINLCEKFLDAWNGKDPEKLYEILGPTAHNDMTLQQFTNQCETAFFPQGQLSNERYVGQVFQGLYLGARVYTLNYHLNIAEKPAVLTVSILCPDDARQPEVLRFDIKTL